MVIIRDTHSKYKSSGPLRHEWVTNYGIVICRCCGTQKRGSTNIGMAKWRITTKDGKLIVNDRKKK